jgi:uncharacterized protein (DUF2235 family)
VIVSKCLVVCCDGTWDVPDQPTPTNVTKVALAIAPEDRSGREQRTYYHPGVGTNRFERIRGGVFGLGLSGNVRDAYRFLVQNFNPGDEIFFFGFSRGAFTARSTAGFVRNSGILRREHADRLDEAWRLYRSTSSATRPRSTEAKLFRRSYSHETRIRFIGVWDTVGALGIPLNGLRFVNVFNRRWQFHDTSLSTSVDAAFHAVAIDEKREPFRPTLWMPQKDAPHHQQIEQVWFSGVHGDVGGGQPDHRLSDIPLLWMMDRAHQCGLNFDSEAVTDIDSRLGAMPNEDGTRSAQSYLDPDPLGPLQESRVGWYRLLPSFARGLGVIDETHEYVSSSAVERHDQTPYAPPNLVEYLNGAPRFMALPDRKTGARTRSAT